MWINCRHWTFSYQQFLQNFPLGYTEEVTYPCADYKPGDDDLQSFDFIRKFELDVNLDGYPGVARVRGSNRMQTAYRIDSTANLVMPTL